MKDNRLWRGKHIFAVWAILTLGTFVVNWHHELKFSEIQDWSFATYWFYLIAFAFNTYAVRYWFRYLAGPQARLYPLDIWCLLVFGFLCFLSLFLEGQQGLLVLPVWLAQFAVFLAYLYFDSHRQKLSQDSDAETTKAEDASN